MSFDRCARGVMLAALLLVCGAVSAAAQASLTVYDDGRVLVRRVFPVAIPAGVSEVNLAIGTIEPGSLLALDSGVVVLESRYDATIDEAGALRRAIGQRMIFQYDRHASDTVSALLVGVDPERFKMADGSIVFQRPGTLRLPEELVASEPSLHLRLRSTKARQQLALAYFTHGTSWQASYQVVVGRNAKAMVQGSAVISNGPLRVDSAEVQLVAGDVGRASQYRPAPMASMARKTTSDAGSSPTEQRVGDVHVYTLPGRWALQTGVVSTISLFEPVDVSAERSYIVEGELPYWGVVMPHGEETEVPVHVRYTLSRPKGTEFGDRPLPAGIVRLFLPDSAGRLQLIGEASAGHTPANHDATLDAGTAFDITARRVQTAYATRRDSTRVGAPRAGAIASYAITLTNAGDTDATVVVKEERGGEWSVISSSQPGEKVSSTQFRFKVKVPAHGDATLSYRVSLVW